MYERAMGRMPHHGARCGRIAPPIQHALDAGRWLMDAQVWKLLLSVILGAVVGWERFVGRKPAGLRTHTLVCLGSTGFMLASEGVLASGGYTNLDPTRVAAGVITGIGFLGAGSIIRDGGSVRGLTTAATIWVSAAIGVAVGTGDVLLAVTLTILTFVVLRGFRWLERGYTHYEREQSSARKTGPR
jgi:uncharacterized membrane protein YhiD involved in acid resistance